MMKGQSFGYRASEYKKKVFLKEESLYIFFSHHLARYGITCLLCRRRQPPISSSAHSPLFSISLVLCELIFSSVLKLIWWTSPFQFQLSTSHSKLYFLSDRPFELIVKVYI